MMKATEAVGLMFFRMYDVQGAISTFEAYCPRPPGAVKRP
jgi:hypothetical protein